MIVHPTSLAGAFVLEPERLVDERGFFARVFAHEELAPHGLVTDVVHANIAFNTAAGTLRGLHFQRAPHTDAKTVRCTAGALFDVIVDLRPSSNSYLDWFGVELTADNRRSLYVPVGCAHGYLTLADDTEATYLHSQAYAPGFDDGVRWDDPAFGIAWPATPVTIISERDARWPDYESRRPPFA